MTAKRKKAQGKRRLARPGKIDRICAAVEDEWWALADEETRPEPRWNRPRKQRVSLRVDREVVDWFKAKGPGYQTRINRILRAVMLEGKRREGV